MTVLPKILAGVAGLALLGVAAPAAAQSYPYGNYGGSNQGGGIVGAIINSVLGGGQYGGYGQGQYGGYGQGQYGAYGQGNDRVAVSQCARAAEMRVNRSSGGGYGGYNQGYDPRYGNQAYGYNQGGSARVVGITRVERKSNGLKVSGVMSSGMGYGGYNQGYDPRYGNQGYGNQGYGAQQADLRFSCRVDYRGRVTDVDINRANVRRGY